MTRAKKAKRGAKRAPAKRAQAKRTRAKSARAKRASSRKARTDLQREAATGSAPGAREGERPFGTANLPANESHQEISEGVGGEAIAGNEISERPGRRGGKNETDIERESA